MDKEVNIIDHRVGHDGLHPDADRGSRHLEALLLLQRNLVFPGLDIGDQYDAVPVLVDVHARIRDLHCKLLARDHLAPVIHDLHPDIALDRACRDCETAHRITVFIHLIICILTGTVWHIGIKELAVLQKRR